MFQLCGFKSCKREAGEKLVQGVGKRVRVRAYKPKLSRLFSIFL
jgi:hypothetical protein